MGPHRRQEQSLAGRSALVSRLTMCTVDGVSPIFPVKLKNYYLNTKNLQLQGGGGDHPCNPPPPPLDPPLNCLDHVDAYLILYDWYLVQVLRWLIYLLKGDQWHSVFYSVIGVIALPQGSRAACNLSESNYIFRPVRRHMLLLVHRCFRKQRYLSLIFNFS